MTRLTLSPRLSVSLLPNLRFAAQQATETLPPVLPVSASNVSEPVPLPMLSAAEFADAFLKALQEKHVRILGNMSIHPKTDHLQGLLQWGSLHFDVQIRGHLYNSGRQQQRAMIYEMALTRHVMPGESPSPHISLTFSHKTGITYQYDHRQAHNGSSASYQEVIPKPDSATQERLKAPAEAILRLRSN